MNAMGERKARIEGSRAHVEDGDGNDFVFGVPSGKSMGPTWIESESTISNPPKDESKRVSEAGAVAKSLFELGGYRFPTLKDID